MTVSIEIPDQLVEALAPNGGDLSRAVLEAVALEGCRQEWLTESQIRRILGFETRMEVHGFLKQHGAYMHYTVDDLEHDSAAALKQARGANWLDGRRSQIE